MRDTLGRGVGSALDPDRPHRRHLHQYPDAEAVRPRARGGRLCAQLGRDAYRPVPRLASAQHAVHADAVDAQRGDGDLGRRASRSICGRKARSQIGTVAMALPLAWQIVNIAGWVAYQITDIFENIGVVQEGMRAIARPLGLPDKPDAKELKVTRGEIAFRGYPLRLWQREGPDRRALARREAGREDRPCRPLRRRQVDAGQSAAALLRTGGRPHPDRRPGHRAGDAGIACARRFRW